MNQILSYYCWSSARLFNYGCQTHIWRVTPFGYQRIKGCLLLPVAFRSLPRPSSPRYAKASTINPLFAWPYYCSHLLLLYVIDESNTFILLLKLSLLFQLARTSFMEFCLTISCYTYSMHGVCIANSNVKRLRFTNLPWIMSLNIIVFQIAIRIDNSAETLLQVPLWR